MDEVLIEAGIERGDKAAIKLRLRELGYKASILLKGPNDRVKFECKVGGWGVNAQHTWTATPLEAIEDGCPHCALADHIANEPPESISEAVMIKAIKEQKDALVAGIEKSRRKLRRSSNNFGVTKYTI